jgi:hypothetical protein
LRFDGDVVDDFPRELPTKINGTATNKSLFHKLNPFKKKFPDMLMKRHSLAVGNELDPQRHISARLQRSGRASSISSLSKSNFMQARPSLFVMPRYEEEQDLLETTSVADLIRAIEMFHTDSAVVGNSQENAPTTNNVSKQHEQQQRKLPSDHLTTPRKSSLLTLLHRQHHSSHTIHAGDVLAGQAIKRGRLYSCVTENLSDNSRRKILGDANPFIKQRSPSLHPPPPYSPSSASSRATSGIRSDLINPTLKRRFSVRPANLDKAPGQFHKIQNYSPTTAPVVPQQQQQQQQTLPTQQPQQLQSQTSHQHGSSSNTSSPNPFTRKL